MHEWHLSHGKDGWILRICSRKWYRVAFGKAWEGTLTLLDHPCCGRGPWRFLPFDIRWWLLGNNRLVRWAGKEDRQWTISLTRDQAKQIWDLFLGLPEEEFQEADSLHDE